jgi:hypothetical protein
MSRLKRGRSKIRGNHGQHSERRGAGSANVALPCVSTLRLREALPRYTGPAGGGGAAAADLVIDLVRAVAGACFMRYEDDLTHI